jgi:hypothetical protein
LWLPFLVEVEGRGLTVAIHVEELSTEVQTVPEPSRGGPSEKSPEWADRARLRAQLARIARDKARTHAERFDD